PEAFASLIPSVVLLFLLGWSLAVLTGSFNVMFQDTQHLAEVGFQILFYATPIMYRLKDVIGSKVDAEKETSPLIHFACNVMAHNPLVAFLDLVRDPILENRAPSTATFGVAMFSV